MKVSWPFGVALRREASNRLMLRWLKTVVVSDEEKAPVTASGGDRDGRFILPLLQSRAGRTLVFWDRRWAGRALMTPGCRADDTRMPAGTDISGLSAAGGASSCGL